MSNYSKYKESYQRAHKTLMKKKYKQINVAVPLNTFELMKKSELYINNANFINKLIIDQLRREGLLPDTNDMPQNAVNRPMDGL